MSKMDRSLADDFYSFSVVFSSEPKVQQKIKEAFFDFLNKCHELVAKNRETNVYQMNFDLVEWT